MRLNRWLIVWLCWLLPFQAVAASFSHCAKMTAFFSTDTSVHLMQSHDHCMHLMDANNIQNNIDKKSGYSKQSGFSTENNNPKDCTACKVHCANAVFIEQSVEQQIHFTVHYAPHHLLIPKISLLISLPYKPPQTTA